MYFPEYKGPLRHLSRLTGAREINYDIEYDILVESFCFEKGQNWN